MKLKPYSQSSGSAGFTLLELLASTSIGLMALGFTLAATLSSRNMYKLDVTRTRINQDLRGTMDVIGTNIRIAGENFTGTFPAIQIIDGVDGGPDTLVLRRNLLDEVLKVCTSITSGSGDNIDFATGSGQGCIYSDNTHNFDSWEAYRDGDAVDAYIFNTSTNLGEWISYTSAIDTGAQYSIVKASGAWENEYDASASAVYVMEEWKFQLVDDTLELTIDGDTDNPRKVAFGLSDFQAHAVLPDGSVRDSYTSSDDWTLLHTVRITLTGQDMWRAEILERSLVSEFFPRNVLSN